MEDVARHAGVSLKTVSRVVNGAADVAPATRARVKHSIGVLDYHPHAGAQNLARRHSRHVGVVVPLQGADVFSRSFIFETLAGASGVLASRGYELSLIARDADAPFIDLIKENRVDGLLLMNVPIGDPRVRDLQSNNAPFVLTCRPDLEGSELERSSHWVDADHRGGVTAAVEHLAQLGHKCFAIVSGPAGLMVSRLRVDGAREALWHLQLPEPGYIGFGDHSIEAGVRMSEELLAQSPRPTAVLCGDDHLAIGVIQGARIHGLKVPEDLSVVGFDDILYSAHVDPPLTTIRQSGHEKGRVAAELMLSLLETRSSHVPPRQHITPTKLIIRGSTGPPSQREGFPPEILGGWEP